MNIRPALTRDFEALLAIDTVASKDDRRISQIHEWIEGKFCHLIELDSEVAAYGALTYHFFDCGFIEILMVGERFRRKRLGLRLVSHFKTICNRPKLFTSTNQSNTPMRLLLAEAGFKGSGYIDNLDEDDPELIFFWAKGQSQDS